MNARRQGADAGVAHRLAKGTALLALAGLVLGACSEAVSKEPTPSQPSRQSNTGCGVSDKGVPACGVLWGIAAQPPTAAGVRAVETKVGRPFDFVYRYHDLNDQIPDANERALVDEGRLLHVAIAARDFSHPDRSQIHWSDVTAGKFDTDLRRQAQGIASLKVPVFVTFEQEASQQRKVDELGTPEQFVDAWRHVHDIYAELGVTNAVWVWVMTGSQSNLGNAARMWPGNAYVDWISWNVYNQSGCAGGPVSEDKFISFEDKMKIFYDFMHIRGPSLGMDVNKPQMISEVGSAKYPSNLALTADWYARIPSVLKKYPSIKALGLWDSVDGSCDYRFDQVPQLVDAVKEAGLNDLVNARKATAQPIGLSNRSVSFVERSPLQSR